MLKRWNFLKTGFYEGIKVVPVIGGLISAGVTAATMRPMGKRLKNHLRKLRYARPGEQVIDVPAHM